VWDSFDPRERAICGIATVTGGRGADCNSLAYEVTNGVVVSVHCPNVEFGKVERTLSEKINSTVVVVYKSRSKPGYVYRFNRKNGDEYVCCRCRELQGNIELAGTKPT